MTQSETLARLRASRMAESELFLSSAAETLVRAYGVDYPLAEKIVTNERGRRA